MRIKLLHIGKTNFKFIDDGIELYHKRIKHLVNFELTCIPDIKNTKSMPVEELKKKEGAQLMKHINASDWVCLLDEKGNSYSSESFAEFISKKATQSIKQLVFIIGGAYGFSKEIHQRSNHKLSLSKMTFSHQIIRIIFFEQLYRAFTIIKGIPYHNQ